MTTSKGSTITPVVEVQKHARDLKHKRNIAFGLFFTAVTIILLSFYLTIQGLETPAFWIPIASSCTTAAGSIFLVNSKNDNRDD